MQGNSFTARDELMLSHGHGSLGAPIQNNEADSADMYKPVLRALRGRYLTAATLGVAGAITGAVLGWSAIKPLYRSEGLVQIAYDSPAVLQPATGERTPPEIYQAFLQSQQAAMMSRRMLDLAMQEEAWKATNLGTGADAVRLFGEGLKVEQKPGTDFLRVMFTGKQATVAGAAVNAIIDAYAKNYNGRNAQSHLQLIGVLEQHKKELTQQRDQLQAQAAQVAQEVAQSDTDKLHEAAAAEVNRLKTMLTDIRLALILSSGASKEQITPQQITGVDPVMHGYIAEKERIETELATLKSRGFMDGHPAVAALHKQLELAIDRIATYSSEYKPQAVGSPAAGPLPADPVMALATRSPESLKTDEQQVQALLTKAEQNMLALGSKRQSLEQLKIQVDSVEKQLNDVDQRIETIKLEGGVGGRLTILASGETPIAPLQDRRPMFAAAGAGLGGLLPAAIIAISGIMRARYRFCDEVEDDAAISQLPVLGVLPLLPTQLDDSEMSTYAAHCVHQIRAMLQNQLESGQKPIFLISSASPGEGKTSLTAALGLSFAASGCRTLVMDCDMVGRQLTRGYSGEELPGLHEAIQAGSIDGFVRETASAGLWVLPVGQGTTMDAGTMSSKSMERILKQAREHFDVVLVDSGPVLGSVEASVIAPQVDGVVLVVSRQQLQPLVQRAVRRLSTLGARTVGMIFNRAERRDFQSVSRSMAPSSGAGYGFSKPPRRWQHDESMTLGPVVSLVATRPSNGRDLSQ